MVHWYQQCVIVHHVPKWMSCHKDTVATAGRAHCFHDYIHIMPIFFCIIWAVWVLWITYDKSLQFILCSLLRAWWRLFGSLVSPMDTTKPLWWYLWWYLWEHTVFMIIYIYICIYTYIIYIWCIIIYMMDTHIQKHAKSSEQ